MVIKSAGFRIGAAMLFMIVCIADVQAVCTQGCTHLTTYTTDGFETWSFITANWQGVIDVYDPAPVGGNLLTYSQTLIEYVPCSMPTVNCPNMLPSSVNMVDSCGIDRDETNYAECEPPSA